MINVPSASTVTKSVSDAVDSIPVDRVRDIDVPDVGDALSNASDFVTDSAIVIGATGGRLATRGARTAWRHRSTIATAVILVLAVVGAVSLWKRRQDSGAEPDIA